LRRKLPFGLIETDGPQRASFSVVLPADALLNKRPFVQASLRS
jgi:hypothetical protein